MMDEDVVLTDPQPTGPVNKCEHGMYIAKGDVIRVEIDGVGSIENRFV